MKRFVLSEAFQWAAYASYYSLGAREAVADLGFLQSRLICARSVSVFFARFYRRVDQHISVTRCSSFPGAARTMILMRGSSNILSVADQIAMYCVVARTMIFMVSVRSSNMLSVAERVALCCVVALGS